MDDILSLLTASDDPQAQMQALAAALRRQKQVGMATGNVGDPVLAGSGRQLVKDATDQQASLQDVPRLRQALALGQQKIDTGEAEATADAATDTPRARMLKQALSGLGLDPGAASAGDMQTMLPTATSAYNARTAADSRREAALARTQPNRDKAQATSDDAEGIAQAIISGQQPPDLKGLYRFAAPVRAHLAKQGYDLTTAQSDWQAVQRHVATLNGTQQERARQAVENATGQLGNVEELYAQWQKVGPASGFRALNKVALAGAKQLGGDAGAVAQNLDGQIQLLASEVGNSLMGGNSPTDHALGMAQTMLSGDWNEETFKKAITMLRRDLTIRKNSMMTSAPAGLSAGSRFQPPVVTAPAAAAPAPGAPVTIKSDAEYEALPSGSEFIAPDGSHRRKP